MDHINHIVYTLHCLIHITAYQSSPAHIEIIVEEKSEEIVKEKEQVEVKLSKKQLAQKSRTIKVGGGI